MTTYSTVAKEVAPRAPVTARRRSLPFGLLAYLGAGMSIVFCYANVLVALAAPLLGLSLAQDPGRPTVFEMNPHLQAVLMWSFGLVTVVGLASERRQHRRAYPMVTGALGFSVIVVTLYTFYDVRILILGYVLLVVAALLNQNAMQRKLTRTVQQQARALESMNRTLEARVEAQVSEMERLARLRRFLAPAVANLITAQDEQPLLDSHRRYVAALFCDMRGFTAFSEGTEPEESIGVLQSYHEQLGRLVAKYGATIDHRAGDGLMVFFNDPLPCEKPVLSAVQLALEMREAFALLSARWKKLGYQLGFGVGVSAGYATLGVVGFEGRYDYTANGNVVNLASRLCDEAGDGQILLSHRAFVEVEAEVEVDQPLELKVKGVREPVIAYPVRDLKAG